MKVAGISTKKILLLMGVVSIAVLILAIIWHNLNFSFFVGLLFNDAKEFASKGTITSNFMPIGYSGFLGSCMKIGGMNGIPACQALIYIGVLLAAFWFLKLRGVSGVLLLSGILVIAFHPLFLLNIWRIHDGNLTVLLLLGFLAAGLSFLRFRNIRSVLLLGVFTGLLFTVRQNTIPLFLVVLFFLSKNKTGENNNRLARIALFLASTAVLMAVVNIVVKQTPFYFGRQGAYNFFAGTNEYAAKYLLSDFSGENSLGEALGARGFPSAEKFNRWFSFPSEKYNQFALEFIKNHPFEYLKLTGLKFFTLLRPGYHAVPGAEAGWRENLKQFAKIILAAPFFVWLFFVYKARKKFFERENLFVFLSIVFYILPFLIANADPRYRFPLDIVFIADSFCRAKQFFTA